MARKIPSALEDIVDLTASLPWWVGVVLAAIAFPALHWAAAIDVVAPRDLLGMGGYTTQVILKTIAGIGQYALPIVFLCGSGVSAYRRFTRERLYDRVLTADEAQMLRDMSWREFEMFVGEAFRRKGFGVRETGGSGPDGGVDLELSAGSDRYLVQCKQWRAYKVGVTTVRELYGVMAATGAGGGFVVTSGEFTRDAAEFAEGRNIELVDLEQLIGLVRETRPESGAASKPDPWSNPVGDAERSSRALTPACPLCGSRMAMRVARRGQNSGRAFWGCSAFPRCRGTLPAR